jgi:hypothetical protein
MQIGASAPTRLRPALWRRRLQLLESMAQRRRSLNTFHFSAFSGTWLGRYALIIGPDLQNHQVLGRISTTGTPTICPQTTGTPTIPLELWLSRTARLPNRTPICMSRRIRCCFHQAFCTYPWIENRKRRARTTLTTHLRKQRSQMIEYEVLSRRAHDMRFGQASS